MRVYRLETAEGVGAYNMQNMPSWDDDSPTRMPTLRYDKHVSGPALEGSMWPFDHRFAYPSIDTLNKWWGAHSDWADSRGYKIKVVDVPDDVPVYANQVVYPVDQSKVVSVLPFKSGLESLMQEQHAASG